MSNILTLRYVGKQDMQDTHNAILCRIQITSFAVETKKKYFLCLLLFNLSLSQYKILECCIEMMFGARVSVASIKYTYVFM